MRATSYPPLHRLYFHHARHGLDGAGDLRGDLVAAGQLELDLSAGAEQRDDRDLAVALGLETARHRIERRLVAHEHAQAFLQLLGRLLERLGRLDARTHVVALRLGGEEEEQGGAGLEKIAILLEALLEDDRLVVAGGG